MKLRRVLLGMFLAAFGLAFAGCPATDTDLETQGTDGEGSGSDEVSELEGTIVADGSSTVYPITEAVAGDFKKKFPKVNVTVAKSGTGGGFKRFVVGDTDISNASRPITPDEFAQCKENKIDFIELPVAYDGLTVVVNPANDWVKQLTVADLQKIYVASDSQPQKWSNVNPEWPDKELKVYSPGTDSGTFDYFKEVLVGKDKEKSMRADMQTSEEDNVLVTGVAGDEGAIGFFGCSYYFENSDKLRAIPIVNAAGEATLPSPEAIESGTYNPLSRPLFIYVSASAFRRPEVKQFVEFYMANAADLSAQVKYVSLPAAIYDQANDCLKNRQTGTHFHTAEGEKREGSLSEVYQASNLVKAE